MIFSPLPRLTTIKAKKWPFIISSGIALLIVVVGAIFIYIKQSPSAGNDWIDVYGRVVNEVGVGIPGVAVDFQLGYFDQEPAPMPFPQNDKVRVVTVVTDSHGDFHVGPVYGFALGPQRFSKGGRDLLPDPTKVQPDIGVVMNDVVSRRNMANTPAKRVTYFFKDPSP